MKKKEPKESPDSTGPTSKGFESPSTPLPSPISTSSTSKSFAPPPIHPPPFAVGRSSFGLSILPPPEVVGYTRFLGWMQEGSWTSIQAVLLSLSSDPGKIPPDYMKDLRLLASYPGVKKETMNELSDLLKIVQRGIKAGKIEESMSPDRWIEWFIGLDLNIDALLFKAYKAVFPDSPFEPISRLGSAVGNFRRTTPPACSNCQTKDAEIQKLKNEIESLKKRKNAGNQNKMFEVIAGLIQANYSRGEQKVTAITQKMIGDLETVGCKVTHETLKKYFDEGDASISKQTQ